MFPGFASRVKKKILNLMSTVLSRIAAACDSNNVMRTDHGLMDMTATLSCRSMDWNHNSSMFHCHDAQLRGRETEGWQREGENLS